MFVWHRVPEYPGEQLQVKLLIPSLQTAPFWQGLEAHSLMFVWHRVPEKPTELQKNERNKIQKYYQKFKKKHCYQPQTKELKPSAQEAPF
jgi:hypothetical protein